MTTPLIPEGIDGSVARPRLVVPARVDGERVGGGRRREGRRSRDRGAEGRTLDLRQLAVLDLHVGETPDVQVSTSRRLGDLDDYLMGDAVVHVDLDLRAVISLVIRVSAERTEHRND